MWQNLAKNALLRWEKVLKRPKFKHVFPKYLKNGPFCHSETYLFIYKPMNRVQKQHKLTLMKYYIYIFKKYREKYFYPAHVRCTQRRFFKPEK